MLSESWEIHTITLLLDQPAETALWMLKSQENKIIYLLSKGNKYLRS